MYQFTTTNIINSNLDSNGTTTKYAGDATSFDVTRVGTFLAANITSVAKRAYYPGILEVAQVTMPVVVAGLVIRLEIDVRLSQQTDSEYANTYLYFKKPVTVEILATGVAATDATTMKNELNKLRDRYGFAYVTATVDTADIILTATNVNQRFYDVKLSEESTTPYANTIIEPKYDDVTASTFSRTVIGRVGFGDDDWMSRRIVIPTMENTRYFGISKDERPVMGGNYTQFTIHYTITKDHTVGIAQANDQSITTHVFYVLDTLAAAFEVELAKTTTVTPVYGGGVIVITGNDGTLANDGTATLVANGAVGIETWVSSEPTIVAVDVSTAGDVTAHTTNDGTAVITVTDAEGTVGTFTIVVA